MRHLIQNLLARLRSSARRPVARPARPAVRPQLEVMEDRLALSATATALPTLSGAYGGYVSPLTMRGFNPQPEPPGSSMLVNPGVARGFNPQPEPPQDHTLTSPLTMRGFNPQPDPPAGTDGMIIAITKTR